MDWSEVTRVVVTVAILCQTAACFMFWCAWRSSKRDAKHYLEEWKIVRDKREEYECKYYDLKNKHSRLLIAIGVVQQDLDAAAPRTVQHSFTTNTTL